MTNNVVSDCDLDFIHWIVKPLAYNKYDANFVNRSDRSDGIMFKDMTVEVLNA